MAFGNFKDKRCASRSCHDSVVEIWSEKGKLLETGRMSDFSETGAAFRTARQFAVGDRLRLRIRLLEKGVMDGTAVVVRSGKDGALNLYGVRFEKIEQVHPTGEYREPGPRF